ncbi:hypothetical protein KO481_25905 [Nocardia sp. NEAU-G5]|uniref:DUF4190 domain-containing protein n=1 Tax=Nocardia albiluteola TaxID=2842303 RepID=A0ABS6B3S3_9NOCA|nr:hypothetical protein [Nocardia albiluteola]MBU3064952.1 hypothetical protein [Nocardia albiluteola]
MTGPETESRPAAELDNLYAVLSLASGLAGLFWIAIIFSTMAQNRPGGRTQAVVGGALGYFELVVLGFWLVYRRTHFGA